MILSLRVLLVLAAFPLTSFYNFSSGQSLYMRPLKEAELQNFEAISDGKKVIVNWTSSGEKSFDYYTVERSKDGINFYPALMIKSAGKDAALFEYTDIDYSPFTGLSYYRLKQNDYFGEYSYSPTVVVNCQILKNGTIQDNGDVKNLMKELSDMQGKPVLVIVRDRNGNEFISKILLTQINGQLIANDVKHQLTQGDYLVVASSCNPLFQQKISIK